MEQLDHLSHKQIDETLAEIDSQEARAEVHAHTEQCGDCADKLQQAKQARDTFLQHNPPRMRAEEIIAAAGKARTPWTWWLPAAVGAVAVLVLVLVAPGWTGDDGIRFKGGPSISYLVLRAGTEKPVPGRDDDRFAPGDAIQIKVSPADKPFVVIVSVDHAGQFAHVFAMETKNVADLPHSLVVDDSSTSERIFVVFSRSAIDPSAIRAATASAFAQAGSIDVMKSFAVPGTPDAVVRSIWVRKKTR